jgi:hypothetical protein
MVSILSPWVLKSSDARETSPACARGKALHEGGGTVRDRRHRSDAAI